MAPTMGMSYGSHEPYGSSHSPPKEARTDDGGDDQDAEEERERQEQRAKEKQRQREEQAKEDAAGN